MFQTLLLVVGVAFAFAEGRIDNGRVNFERSLQEDEHAHDDLASVLKWAGIFHFTPGATYNLTVKVPEADADPHAGHAHRGLLGARSLQESDDDHAGHDHTETEEEEEDSAHDHDGDGVPDHAPEDHSSHDDSSSQADVHFLLALVPVSGEGQEGIAEARGILEAMEGNVIDVDDGAALVSSTAHAFELFFHDPQSTGTLSITNITQEKYVLFMPATPSQVEGPEFHFLVDEVGADVWPETANFYQEQAPRDGDKPWGQVIGATLLINLVTLIGVIFLVPMLTTAFQTKTFMHALKDLYTSPDIQLLGGRRQQVFDMCITSFACGALLATCVFLIVPEAIGLVNAEEPPSEEGEDPHAGHDHRLLQEDDHEGHDHGNNNWVFGTSVLAGFLFPMFLASFFPHHHGHADVTSITSHTAEETAELRKEDAKSSDDENTKDEIVNAIDDSDIKLDSEAEEEEVKGSLNPVKKEVNKRLVSGILLGDALHNFADGVFVGAAFLLCTPALGWSVLASTIYHELAQEVSDFFILTTHAHLPPLVALALNFASGLSVALGGIIVLATNVSNYTLGVILSMSAGVYINVAAKECMPTVDRLAVTTKDRVIALLSFAIGAIPIGLVLLNHEHCEA